MKIKIVYRLTRETPSCGSLVQKICIFLQKETSRYRSSSVLDSRGPKHYIFKVQITCIPLFSCYVTIILPELDWTSRKLWILFQLLVLGNSNWITTKFEISFEFSPLQVKWWYHIFSGIKMEEFIESEHSGIFRVELVTKNVVLGSSGTSCVFVFSFVMPQNQPVTTHLEKHLFRCK